MSEKIFSLLNNTFDNGTVHIKNLEQVIKLIVQKLDNNVGDKSECSRKEFMDPVGKLFSSIETMKNNVCTENDKNSMTEIINLLNVTKRIEALEISVHKLTSIVHTFIKHEKYDRTELVQLTMEQEKSKEDKLISFDNGNENLQSHEKLLGTRDLLGPKENLIEQHDFNFITTKAALRNQICDNERQMKIIEDKFKDLFFACEQNEEKIDETILSLDSLKSKHYCLESRFKELDKILNDMDDRFATITNVCENLEKTTADKSFIIGDLMSRLNDILLKLAKVEELENKYESVPMLQNSFLKFQEDIKKTLTLIKIQVDDKMDRNIHKDFKTCFLNNFENFIKDLKIILSTNNQKTFALGSSMKLESNLSCISCRNNVFMNTELDSTTKSHLQVSKRRPKSAKLKAPFLRKMPETETVCPKNPCVSFPLPQQCFIITRDNSIFKADPLECLKNPNYKRVQ